MGESWDWVPRWSACFGWLVLSVVASALGCGLYPVASLAWVHPAATARAAAHALLAAEAGRAPLAVRALAIPAALYGVQALAWAAGLASALGGGGSGGADAALVALAAWAPVALAYASDAAFAARFPASALRPVVLAAALTAAWAAAAALSPLGDVVSPAAALAAGSPALSNLAAVTGSDGIVFVATWGAALLHHSAPPRAHASGPARFGRGMRAHWVVYGAVLFALLTAGGFRATTEPEAGDAVRASCVLGAGGGDSDTPIPVMLGHTAARIAAGDDIVLWSEQAVRVQHDEGEHALLAAAAKAVRDGNAGRVDNGTYVGITYSKWTSEYKRGTENRFALFDPDGNVTLSHIKAHPVKLVESGTYAAKVSMTATETRMGRVSAAISFDLDFVGLPRAAGRAQVALMLQPSATWGNLGPRHFVTNALRAIESGFTIARCSTDGVSGVVSPYGRFEEWHPTRSHSVLTLEFQRPEAVATVHDWFGFLFVWAVAALALFLTVTSFTPQSLLRVLPRWAVPAQEHDDDDMYSLGGSPAGWLAVSQGMEGYRYSPPGVIVATRNSPPGVIVASHGGNASIAPSAPPYRATPGPRSGSATPASSERSYDASGYSGARGAGTSRAWSTASRSGARTNSRLPLLTANSDDEDVLD